MLILIVLILALTTPAFADDAGATLAAMPNQAARCRYYLRLCAEVVKHGEKMKTDLADYEKIPEGDDVARSRKLGEANVEKSLLFDAGFRRMTAKSALEAIHPNAPCLKTCAAEKK